MTPMTFWIIYSFSVAVCCYALKTHIKHESQHYDITLLHGFLGLVLCCIPVINFVVALVFVIRCICNRLESVVIVKQQELKTYTLEDYRKEFAYRDPDYNP